MPFLEIALPALGGLFTTIALVVKYFDRRAKERAILAAKTDQQREDIASIPPLSLIFVLTLASSVLCCVAAVGVQVRAALAARESAMCAKDCKSDDDCRPPAVCKRGLCVQTAVDFRFMMAMLVTDRNRNLTAWSPINGH